jgi:hypothetical protein
MRTATVPATTTSADAVVAAETGEPGLHPRGSQLAYSILEFNFALQGANDPSQLAHYRHPVNLLSCLEGLGSCRVSRPHLTSSHHHSAE